MTLPLTATVQLNAAYVPVIVFPLRVAERLYGHSSGSLGVRIAEMFDPFMEPVNEPPLVTAPLAKVADQVPVSGPPDWLNVIRTVPGPTRLSVMLPVHVPAIELDEGDEGLEPHAVM